MDSTKRTIRKAGFLAVVLGILVLASMGAMGPLHTMANGKINTSAATTSETGKAVFVGNYELNVSWALFTDQTTGKVYYSQTTTITDKTANVTFTTKNYTVISGLEIGTYYLLIQNGSSFPTTVYEFTSNVPVSSVLEGFHATYIGNDQFNISWVKFPGQEVVMVYWALGNSTNLTNTSQFFIGNINPYLVVTFNNYTSKNVNFLLVNDSLFPKGEVNYTSYIVITSMTSTGGFIIGFNGYGLVLSEFDSFVAALVIIFIVALIAAHRHKKHKRGN